jgi:hypothetical protein
MSVSSVTLDEVLAAAQVRGASLVPETSGYLALAIADASARLPFRLEDGLVHLSTEGTVKVARGTEVVEPEECAAIVRDILARLLGRSIGSMPGLSAAARPRQETHEGVEAVIADLEAALVPVNRAAARRALARLARETVKARESGRLRRRSTRPAAQREVRGSERPVEAPEARVAREGRPQARATASIASRSTVVEAPKPRRPEPREVAENPRAAAFGADEPQAVEVTFSEPPPDVAAPAAEAVEREAPEPVHEPTPTDAGAAFAHEELHEPTTIDSVAVVLEQARIAARAPMPTIDASDEGRSPSEAKRSRGPRRRDQEATFDAAQKKSVDDLVASFSVSGYDSDGTLRATRSTLKRLAGLDATPPPPSVAVRGKTPPPPRVAEVPEVTPVPTAQFGRSRRGFDVGRAAWVVVGLVLAGLLGHYVPTWLDRTGSAEPPAAPDTELSRRN